MSVIQAIDWVFISLILLMMIHGYIKGFIGELFSWAALALSLWAAVLLFPAGGALIRTRIMANVRVVPELLAFVAIFILIMLVIKFLEHILRDVIEGANLGTVNRVFGAAFGIVEGLAFAALISFVLSVQPLFNASNLIRESFFSQLLLPLINIPLNRGRDIVDTALVILSSTGG